MNSGNKHDNLTAAFIDQTAIIRVEGRGSFKTSPPMKLFIQRMIESGSTHRILIDMLHCSSMDSTFMGVLAGLSYHLRDYSGITLKLLNLSEKNQKLLMTLGVDRVVNYSLSCDEEEKELLAGLCEDVEPLVPDGEDLAEAARTALAAHETLVNINPENLIKFKSVIELLQHDVRNLDL